MKICKRKILNNKKMCKKGAKSGVFMKNRSEIEEKYKWDLTKFCKSDEDFYALLQKLENESKKFAKFEGRLGDDKVLLEYLNFKCQVLEEAGKTSYAFLRQCEDRANRAANDMVEKRTIVLTKLDEALTPLENEIDRFSLARLQSLHKNAKFKVYSRYFEATIRHKKHALSKKEELLLSKIGQAMGGAEETFDKISDVDFTFEPILDSKGKKHEFNQSNYSLYVESDDRTLRKNAFTRINAKRGEFINTLASTYISSVKEDCVMAKIRKYKSALDCAITCEEASEEVYDLLIKKVRENVGILHEFFEIKRKMLGLSDFAVYDTFAPVTKGLSEKKYTFDEAIELVKKATAPLGEEYLSLIDRAKNERWIDVFPNKNKYSGAFSSGTEGKGMTPVVLLNFEGNLESVFTLAHELGHAMHSYFSNKNQPFQTADYVIFVAEVASTVNEQLLLNYLLGQAKTDKEKIYFYDYFLRSVRSTIFRQTMFAEFEQFAHETYEKEQPLSPELLCEEYENLNNFYHGKKVKQIPEMRFEWARIPHFYDSFYVYKYATGLISAINISGHVLSEPNFAKKYLEFLSSGCKKDPISLLKIANCDLTQEKTFDDVFALCKDFLKKWEALLKN